MAKGCETKNNLETLTALCKEQGRAVFTSSYNNYSSIVVTEPNVFESIDKSMGGSNSLEEYAGLLLESMMTKIERVK